MTHEITENNPFCVMGLFIGDAQAQDVTCFDSKQIKSQLLAQHGEVVMARGMTPQSAMLEVMVSPAGSFTVLITVPRDPIVSCIVAVGTSWQAYSRDRQVEEAIK